MKRAYISIGSNIGERFQHLKNAVQSLHSHDGVSVLTISSIYETAPVGYTDQADFLNVVIAVETQLGAQQLLEKCQQIEQQLGRVRDIRWGPRTVDLDILLYNGEDIATENLVVPHPRMHERAFVLVPLLEISPTVEHPVTGRKYSEEAAVRDDSVRVWREVDGIKLNPSSS